MPEGEIESGRPVSAAIDEDRGTRIEILDLIILVAAFGLGIAWLRSYITGYLLPFLGKSGALPQRYAFGLVLAALPMLACWSVGLTLCQLKRSGWDFRRATGRSATLAPAIITAALLMNVMLILIVQFIGRMIPGFDAVYRLQDPTPVSYVLAFKMADCGLLVGVAWQVQVGLGAREKAVTWVDAWGRLVEVAWLLLWLITSGIFYSLMI